MFKQLIGLSLTVFGFASAATLIQQQFLDKECTKLAMYSMKNNFDSGNVTLNGDFQECKKLPDGLIVRQRFIDSDISLSNANQYVVNQTQFAMVAFYSIKADCGSQVANVSVFFPFTAEYNRPLVVSSCTSDEIVLVAGQFGEQVFPSGCVLTEMGTAQYKCSGFPNVPPRPKPSNNNKIPLPGISLIANDGRQQEISLLELTLKLGLGGILLFFIQ